MLVAWFLFVFVLCSILFFITLGYLALGWVGVDLGGWVLGEFGFSCFERVFSGCVFPVFSIFAVVLCRIGVDII